MNKLHRKKLGVAEGHRIVQRDVKIIEQYGRLVEVYWYDEINTAGLWVNSHVLTLHDDITTHRDAGSLASVLQAGRVQA